MSSFNRLKAALLIAVATSGLAACAIRLAPEALPVCDGRHRQPANPHGSILVPLLSPEPSDHPGPSTPLPHGSDRSQHAPEVGSGGCA